MNSFSKLRKKRRVIPDGLFLKCEKCSEIVYVKKLDENLRVCPKCGYHYSLDARSRIEMLTDEDSFQETQAGLVSGDPLEFQTDGRTYGQKKLDAQAKSGVDEAIITGTGRIEGRPVSLAVMEFQYIGGSIGSAVGEKIARAAELAIEQKLPLVLVAASGGVRMQEGIIGLAQMAKTAAAVGRLKSLHLPYLVVLTNPTYGGATASFAMLGDIIIAEPGAMVGFAGQRVIKQTIRQDLPEGFQTAEFLLEHGQIDLIAPRSELKSAIARCLDCLCSRVS